MQMSKLSFSAEQGLGLGLMMLPLVGSYWGNCIRDSDELNLVSMAMVFLRFRMKSFKDFMQSHRESLKKGQESGDFVDGVCNYYSEMHALISMTNGPFWHFVPWWPGKTLRENHIWYHEILAQKYLKAQKGDKILEIGCGYGELGRNVAMITGASVTGLTMAAEEIEGGNQRIKAAGLQDTCCMVQGNYHDMKLFTPGSFDKIFGVYTVKYSANLDGVFGEVSRLLRPGGTFLSYEILVSDKYNPDDAKQRSYVEAISTSTCMPPLHHAKHIRAAALKAGLVPVLEEDMSEMPGALPWYYAFTRNGVYQILQYTPVIHLVKLAEMLRIFPPSFADWFQFCVYHPTTDFVNAGKLGIIHASTVMIWKKA